MYLDVVVKEVLRVLAMEPGSCPPCNRIRNPFPRTRKISVDVGSKEVRHMVTSEKVEKIFPIFLREAFDKLRSSSGIE